jgi:hypothetical protein
VPLSDDCHPRRGTAVMGNLWPLLSIGSITIA